MKKDIKKLTAVVIALILMLGSITNAFALAAVPERALRSNDFMYRWFRYSVFGTYDEVSTYDEAEYPELVHNAWNKMIQSLEKRDNPTNEWNDLGISVFLTDEAVNRGTDYTADDFPEIYAVEFRNDVEYDDTLFFRLGTEKMSVQYLKELFYILAERNDIYYFLIGDLATPDEPVEPTESTEPEEPTELPIEPTNPTEEPTAPSEPIVTEPTEPFVLTGDVDGNGVVDSKDRIILTRYLAKWNGYTIDPKAADTDKDNEVNSKDRIILTRHLAKWNGYETLG